MNRFFFHAVTLVLACGASAGFCQAPPAPGGPVHWGMLPMYPQRETDPAAVERGRDLYVVNGCAFCHGQDTRGGNGGPSLLRSQMVQRDQRGELIGEVISKGVPGTTMTSFTLAPDAIADIAEFLHSFSIVGRDPARDRPDSIVTGDVAAGKRYFDAQCAACHAADADLRGLAGRIPDPRALQQQWLMPRRAPPVMVAVTPPDGETVTGTLARMDEFIVSLQTADGTRRTFERYGKVPRVELRDPLDGHKALLARYTDRNIHDVTAYLVTLK